MVSVILSNYGFTETQNPSISAEVLCPAAGYSPRTGLGPSTIAASELNFRVRDGNGCNITAWATGLDRVNLETFACVNIVFTL
jgi:hypothetical protein